MQQLIRKRARELPFASIEAGFGGGAQALMVLEAFGPDGTLDWGGANGQLITTRGPIVTRLIGLEIELTDTSLGSDWRPDLREMIGRRAVRQARFRADRVVEVEMASRFEIDGEDDVELLAGPKRLLRIQETVSSGGQPRFANHYWVERDSGFCWQSRQTPVPTLPVLQLRIMKRPNR